MLFSTSLEPKLFETRLGEHHGPSVRIAAWRGCLVRRSSRVTSVLGIDRGSASAVAVGSTAGTAAVGTVPAGLSGRSPTPRAKRFSRKYWPTMRIEVNEQVPERRDDEQRDRVEDLDRDVARRGCTARSVNGTAVTSEVVFSIEMTSLPVGGMMTRIACGRMTRRIVCAQLMPSAVAASSWPGSTESRPARTISAMYAASLSDRPITASQNTAISAVGRRTRPTAR